ncbi:MAG TPA: 50S ribosomal protein L1 [bacterium]|nr:50S ribosomal protein L1 [bacterium]
MVAEKSEKEEMPQEEISEKELLKQAEEREKARKEEEELKKTEAKEEEKEEKKKAKALHATKKAQVRKKPRHGKKYREILKQIDQSKIYSLDEAVELALTTNPAKFDATIELHVKLDDREKNIRGMVVLPGGVTKEKRILEATTETVDNIITDVKAGKINFDVLIAETKVMPKLASLAKILGPKGLMPAPKAGTVVDDTKAAAAEMKGGKVEFRADKNNIIHMAIGKISFGSDRVKSNYKAVLEHLPKRINTIFLSTSMGPSIRVQ